MTLVLGSILGASGVAAADRLLVYGPPGSGAERRALAVLERDDGTCASWEQAELVADEPGVQVVTEPTGEACTRWLTLTSDPPRPSVTLLVRTSAGAQSRVAVAMGGDHGLGVRATRAGRGVRVVVTGAPPADTTVTAVWRDGERRLSPGAESSYTGEVPAAALVAIIVRSGDLVGADAVVPATGRLESQALVVPSALAVPAGAAVRTAAIVVATDRRGRLSRDVPLHVSSDRGRLRSMTWLRPGVAAIALTTDAGVPSVDLRVWTSSESDARAIEIPVQADWPIGARIDAPAEVERGHDLLLDAGATLLGGTEASDPVDLAVRCGTAAATRGEDGHLHCVAPQGPSVSVIATAVIDGRVVPLAHQQVAIREPPPPPPTAPVPVAHRVAPRASAAATGGPLAPTASLAAGVDSGGNAAWGAGLGARWTVTPRVLLTATARYAGAAVDVPAAGPVQEPLVGTRHGAELLLGGGIRLLPGPTSLVAAIVAGPSWVGGNLRVGTADVPVSAVRMVGQVSAGPRTRLGNLELGLNLGLRVVPLSSESTWREPLATAFVEAIGVAGGH